MPIFMIGTQRSGSNLLRLMLNQLPGIAAPHPPHILSRFMPLLPNYGDLRQPEQFAQLVDDVCRLVELNPVPWEGVVLNRIEVLRRCRAPTLVAVFGAVYDLCAAARNADTWCCKSLQNIQHLPAIDEYFADARYIYLCRDGRDVACSFRKAVVGEKHFYAIAREWAETQRLALAHRERISPERFFSLSYEELTGAPERTMRRLCQFLGVSFAREMLDFHQSDEARRAAESSALWGNVTKPVMEDNTRKFLREATAEDIRIFESVAGDVLDALGYERACVVRGQERRFTVSDLETFEQENRRIKDEVQRATNSDDRVRRDRQSVLLGEIRARPAGPAPWMASGGGARRVNRRGSAL
jgi:hypothetical protein